MDATLPLLSATGRMDPAAWSRFIAWMRDNGQISGRPSPADLLSNAYLPGSIPE